MVSESAEGDGADFTRKQARLFLAFLPFPGQWSSMREVEAHYGNDPEVKEFLADEEREILRKSNQAIQPIATLRLILSFGGTIRLISLGKNDTLRT